MDSDPRIIEINKQLKNLQEQIEQQRQKIREVSVIKKIKEWRILKRLKQEHTKKQEFKQKLITNLKKNARRKNKNRRVIY